MAVKQHPENSEAGKAAKAKAVKADAASVAGAQAAVDDATAKGFVGFEVDQTPNENYTVAGVLAGLPTPETDATQAAAAREGMNEAERHAAGVAER